MKREVLTCDICGKEIEGTASCIMYVREYYFISGESGRLKSKMDICPDCMSRIKDYCIKSKKEN